MASQDLTLSRELLSKYLLNEWAPVYSPKSIPTTLHPHLMATASFLHPHRVLSLLPALRPFIPEIPSTHSTSLCKLPNRNTWEFHLFRNSQNDSVNNCDLLREIIIHSLFSCLHHPIVSNLRCTSLHTSP